MMIKVEGGFTYAIKLLVKIRTTHIKLISVRASLPGHYHPPALFITAQLSFLQTCLPAGRA